MDVPSSARKTKTCHIWVDRGVVYQVMLHGEVETEGAALANYEVMLELAGGEPLYCLVDIRFVGGVERGAREFYGGGADLAAAALVVESAVSRVVGNVFLGISRPAYPIRLFNDVEGAEDWLRSLRQAAG